MRRVVGFCGGFFFDGARARCVRSLGRAGDAAINEYATAEFMANGCVGGRFVLGGKRGTVDCDVFVDEASGTPLTFANWNPEFGEPNNYYNQTYMPSCKEMLFEGSFESVAFSTKERKNRSLALRRLHRGYIGHRSMER